MAKTHTSKSVLSLSLFLLTKSLEVYLEETERRERKHKVTLTGSRLCVRRVTHEFFSFFILCQVDAESQTKVFYYRDVARASAPVRPWTLQIRL